MMKDTELIQTWTREEEIAHVHGWDFSHIDSRYEEDALPWDYRSEIRKRLRADMMLLDIDTGGGEFLLSLQHPHDKTCATEYYPPNVLLCSETLRPLGIDFRVCNGKGMLPFNDGSFDMVIDRHGDLNAVEICRVLRTGGICITEQVGANNDLDLAELLLGSAISPFPELQAKTVRARFIDAGFMISKVEEYFGSIRFFDIGALVWFARIIEWEFPGFSVASCKDRLLHAQQLLEQNGCIEGQTHRFLLIAQKSA